MASYLVYMTARDADEARRIGSALVEQRLAACVNIVPSIRSLFWWEDAVQSESEAALVAKTVKERFPELLALVKSLHSYQTPCVVALPIEDGNPDFLRWIEEETRNDAHGERD